MAVRLMEIEFENTFKGLAKAPNTDISIGVEQGDVTPYDMMFAALASCLYATLLEILAKKKINFDKAKVIVKGEKRTTVPTTLEWVDVEFVLYKPSKEIGLEKSIELTTKYCSIYQTIGQVAKMSYSLTVK